MGYDNNNAGMHMIRYGGYAGSHDYEFHDLLVQKKEKKQASRRKKKKEKHNKQDRTEEAKLVRKQEVPITVNTINSMPEKKVDRKEVVNPVNDNAESEVQLDVIGGYDAKWRRASKRYLQVHPVCEVCQKDGRYVKATVVDYIIPPRGDQKLFWDRGNWQALCKRCHNRKTWREDQKPEYHIDVHQ